jgi:CBS domain-containing protein
VKVRDAMSKLVLTIGPAHTLRQAARVMSARRVGAAVVTDPEHPGVGILTERDILDSVGAGQDPDTELAAAHRTTDVVFASPDWTLEQAAATMVRAGFRHLIVLEGSEVTGLLSMRDIVRCWSEAEPRRHVDHRAIVLQRGDDRRGHADGRDGGRPAAGVGGAAAGEERGVDHARNDQAHADTAAAHLVPEAFREGAQRRLGRRVDRLAADAGDTGDRGHEDDRAAAALGHARHQQPGQLDRRGQVHRGKLADLAAGDLAHRPGPPDARVVHQDVDRPGSRPVRRLGEPSRAVHRGQITGKRHAPGPPGRLGKPCLVLPAQQHLGPGAGQCRCGRRPDPRRRPGHQRHRAIQPHAATLWRNT